MKDYSIWLTSGGCITGTVNEENEKLISEFDSCQDNVVKFDDTDGYVKVQKNKIAAVGFNKIAETAKAGY